MRLMKSLICLMVLMVITLLHTQISFAADSEWYWINSDDKYSKYFSMTRINVTARQNNIPTCIEDWIKTGYAPEGAAEAISNMKLPISDPYELSYSLARIQIDPQNRTLTYLEEIFYDKDGKVLYTLNYTNKIKKDINSQSFDEKFYAMIVDRVFNQGEGGRLISKDRWLNLWSNSSGNSSADTATLRKINDNVIVWLWQENKDESGNVNSIQFMKKEYDVKSLTARTLKYSYWSFNTGWVDKTSSLDKNMHSIIPESTEDAEFSKIKQFAALNPSWAYRYQMYNPTLKASASNASTSTTSSSSANSSTSANTTSTSTTATTTTVNNANTNNTTKTTAVSPAAKDVTNPIGSVGPISAPVK